MQQTSQKNENKDELAERYKSLLTRSKDLKQKLEELKEEGHQLYLNLHKAVDEEKKKKIRSFMSRIPD